MREDLRIAGADQRLRVAGRGGAARRALGILLLGAAVGLLFGAEPLRSWAEPLPVLGRVAAWWNGVAGPAGLNGAFDRVRAAAHGAGRD